MRPNGKFKDWSSVFRVSNRDGNCCKVGQRAPAVWFLPKPSRLYICFDINGSNRCFSSNALKKGKYYRVEIKQEFKYGNRYRYSVEIEGYEVYTITNTKAQVYDNVKLYMGDAHYEPAKCTIRNFKWINIGE